MKRFVKIVAVVVAVMMLTSLCACAPSSNPQKAVAVLKKHNYSAGISARRTMGELEGICGCERGDITDVVRGYGYKIYDGETLEHITIIYCKSNAVAQKAYENLKIRKGSDNPDWVVEHSGKIVYYGTKNAVKAAVGL